MPINYEGKKKNTDIPNNTVWIYQLYTKLKSTKFPAVINYSQGQGKKQLLAFILAQLDKILVQRTSDHFPAIPEIYDPDSSIP